MPLQAILTVGWNADPNPPLSALRLHEEACSAGEASYSEALAQRLKGHPSGRVSALEGLFRRRAGGYEPLKSFVETLNRITGTGQGINTLDGEIDVFAYAFLKGAKNFDFLLPEQAGKSGPFRERYPEWRQKIHALQEFERIGRPIPQGVDVDTAQYLRLRRVLSRPTARDERLVLATLLVSGPSSVVEIAGDLAVNYPLSPQLVEIFVFIDIVERRNGDSRYAIRVDALPVVVFCLRGTLGFDLLATL